MAQDIPQYIREMFDRAQAVIGGYGGIMLELEPFALGVEHGEIGRKEPGNHSASYEAGYTAGKDRASQVREPGGSGRPMKFGFLQQRPSRLS
jgi:hypothetical protein